MGKEKSYSLAHHDSGLFGFVLNLVVSTALTNPAASLEVLSVSLKFLKAVSTSSV